MNKRPLIAECNYEYPYVTNFLVPDGRGVKEVAYANIKFGHPATVTLYLEDQRPPFGILRGLGSYLEHPERHYSFWHVVMDDGVPIVRDQDGILQGVELVGRFEDKTNGRYYWVVKCECDVKWID